MSEEQQTPPSRGERRKAKKKQSEKKKVTAGTWIKRTILTIFLVGLVGVLTGLGFFAYYVSQAPELDEELLKDPLSAEFYDKDGELFATIGAENRTYVAYDDIPQNMIDAILATEDSRFFEHSGIDFFRLMSAVVANITNGFGSQGASTITQQVVKNSFFTNEKTLERKAQEAYLAYKLEQEYSKEEIFEMYFNKILMSGRIYGFGTAATYFYGKELNELSLDEMATLAGMPQSPNNYNPFNYPENAENRRNIVLSLMVQHEKITEAEAAAAKGRSVAEAVLPEGQRNQFTSTDYPAFLQVVLEEVEQLQTSDQPFSLDEGVKIYTTLDRSAQEIVEQKLADDANFPTEDIQTGVAVVDTKTGALRAIGGGRNYGEERGWNYAYNLNRSPGSTIKPLAVYGPVIDEEQWSTGTTLIDEPYTYKDGQRVTNWDGQYHGAETLRYALSTSRNVPAVKIMHEIGTEASGEFMARLGIDIPEHGVYESDALGGGNISLSPIEMAGAYAAFGNNGVFTEPYVITEVKFRDGRTENYTPESHVAMQDYTAYMITDILRDVVAPDGSARRAGVRGVDVAGKTGTTNYSDPSPYPSGAVPDTWFVGYSPSYSIAVWGGYEKNTTPITTWDERYMPQTLFKTIMTDLSEGVEDEEFKKPSSVYEQGIVPGSIPLRVSASGRYELFVRGGQAAQQVAPPKEQQDDNEQEEAKEGLPAPSGFSATANGSTAALSWSYEQDATFTVTVSVDGASQTVTTTSGKSASFSPLEQGKTYTFAVVASAGGQKSAAATATINLAGASEDEAPEEEPTEEAPTDPPATNDEEEEEPTSPNEGSSNNGTNNNGSTNNGASNGNNGNGNGNGNGNNSQPTEPTQPAEPAQPAQPSQPAEPTPPVEEAPPVVEPTPTDPPPAQPTEPADGGDGA